MEDQAKLLELVTKTHDQVSTGFATVNGDIEALKSENAALTQQITDLKDDHEQKLKDLQKSFTESKAVSLPGVEEEKENFSFCKAFRAISRRSWEDAGYEKEVLEQATKAAKAQGTTPATSGGYLVPIQISQDVIERLVDNLTITKLGVTVMRNLMGEIQIPKRTGGPTTYWVTENKSTITESELTFGQVSLRPKSCAALVVLSNQVLNNTQPAIEAMVREDFAFELGLAAAKAILTGSGVNGEPIGIINIPGINTIAIGAAGGRWEWEHAQDMETELEVDKALRGNLGFVMHTRVKNKLKKMRIPQYAADPGGEYTMLPMSDDQFRNFLGYPFVTTTEIPINLVKGGSLDCSYVFFGNWRESVVGMWGGLEISASDSAGDAFEKNQVKMRAIFEMDHNVRHAESFCLCSDARTT